MNYELVYILSPKLSDNDAEKKAQDFNQQIKENTTEIVLEDFWGKKDLAYPIKKLEQGYYVLLQFKAERENIKKIDKKLKLEDEIIRYLLIKKDEFAPEKKKAVEEKAEKETVVEKPAEIFAINEKPAESEAPADQADKDEEIKEDVAIGKEKEEKKSPKPKKAKADISDLDKKIDDILDSGIDD